MAKRLLAVLSARDNASPAFKRAAAGLASLGAVAAAVGVGALGRKLVQGIGESVKAAAVQEAAEVRLAQALRNRGHAVEELLPQIKKQAAAIQDLTGVGDEEILKNQALLVSLGNLTGKGLERATKASLDLAAATDRDASAAFQLVAKAAAGYTGELSRYGILIDNSLPKAQKFNAALVQIEKQFGGQAQEKLRTYEGALQAVQGRFGDLKEAIGGPFRDVLTQVFTVALDPAIKNLTLAVDESDALRVSVFNLTISLVEMLKTVVPATKTAAVSIGGVASSILGHLKIIIDDVKEAFAEAEREGNEWSLAGFAAVEQDVDSVTQRLNELSASLKAARDNPGGNNRENRLIPELSGASEKIKQWTIDLKPVVEILTKGAAAGEAWKKALADNPPLFQNFNSKRLDEYLNLNKVELVVNEFKELSRTVGEVRRNLESIGVDAFLRLSDAAVDAATGADVAWREFFRNFLRDVARSITQMLLLRALSGVFPNAFQFSSVVGSRRTGGPAPVTGQYRLHAGEYVLRPEAARAIGPAGLSELNRTGSVGGAMSLNVTNHNDFRGASEGAIPQIQRMLRESEQRTFRAVQEAIQRGGRPAAGFQRAVTA